MSKRLYVYFKPKKVSITDEEVMELINSAIPDLAKKNIEIDVIDLDCKWNAYMYRSYNVNDDPDFPYWNIFLWCYWDQIRDQNHPQGVDDFKPQNRPQAADDLLKEICSIPWYHQRTIIDKCKGDAKKALFFVRKVIENSWGRDMLLNFLSTDLYERQAKAITNFSKTLPALQSDLAQQTTKDPYVFNFLTMTEDYNERELEDALVANVTKFLVELGTGFAYMGRQYRMQVGEKEIFIDLLFYNTRIHAYCCIELKTGSFQASYLGQLGLYVTAVNHQLKTEHDNPTIGLLICKDKDNIEAQYSLEAYNLPLGISQYELSKLIPNEIKSSLPTIEEIESTLEQLSEEDKD